MAEALVPRETIYRWDLDKTYLRTDFDTVRDLLRTALEAPDEKRTVPGASILLRELRATGPAGITILSGSPEQMRKTLEAKLRLDGIHWDSFTLKPSLRNLLKGRFRFLKDQVSYKLASLLDARTRVAGETQEVLFGDDAEADAFIYSLYADLCAGRIGNDTLVAVLERAQVYPEDVPDLLQRARRVSHVGEDDAPPVVRRIFIHLDRMSAPELFTEFGHRLCPFHNYFQPAVVLCQDGGLEVEAALRIGADLVMSRGFAPDALTASVVDLGRRRFIGRELAERFVASAAAAERRQHGPAAGALREFASGLEGRLGVIGDAVTDLEVSIDYVDLFSRDKERARAARRRATRRRRNR